MFCLIPPDEKNLYRTSQTEMFVKDHAQTKPSLVKVAAAGVKAVAASCTWIV